MAEYRLTFTADGVTKHELDYKGKTFDFSMIPDETGKTSDKRVFDAQVSEVFPNEDEEVLLALEELGFADEDEIEDILSLLTEYEHYEIFK